MKKRIYLLVLAALLVVTGFCGRTVYATNTSEAPMTDVGEDDRIIRVGYYEGDTAFQDGFSDAERKTGYAYEYYQAIGVLTGWKYEYVYGTKEQVLDLLVAGDVDMVAGVSLTDSHREQLLFSKADMGLDRNKRYFAVSKDSPELKEELDYAMGQIAYFSPNYTINLIQKYYVTETHKELTDKERKWVKARENLRIGYLRNNLPISGQDEEGNPTGIAKEIIERIRATLRVEIVPVCYDGIAAMEEGLSNGEVDAIFPMYSDLWLAESEGFRQTSAIISDRVMVVYQGNYTSDIMNKVALSITGIGQKYYIASHYPDSEIVYYDSRHDAFEAVKSGEVRCMIGCSSVLQHFLKEHPEYQDLNIAYLDVSEHFGMAVREENNILVGILDKVIAQIDENFVSSALLEYSSVDTPLTFMDFLRRYATAVVGVLLVFITIILLLFIAYLRKTRLFNEEQEKNRVALEKALEAANVANEAKTAFLSSMSHDIRTPMNAIVGMTAIATNHINDRNKVAECLDKISLSCHHLLSLINDILDVSKIESGMLSLSPIVFSLRDTVSALVNIIRPQIRAKNQEFDVHVSGMEYEILYADEVRISQIFINILSNASKYTPEGGKVVMSLSEELLPDKEHVRLVYTVEDNGMGMSAEFMENMYNKFSRAHDTRINEIQGTGLGLTIVKQMVDMMDGTIECESEEGMGTKFVVTLELPIQEPETEKPMLEDAWVLVVDDDPIFLENAVDVLTDMGAQVRTANEGEAAIEIVKSIQKDAGVHPVVIVDWKMPHMDGIETISEMRKLVGDAVPILLVSAYDVTDMEDEAIRCGATGFMSKPLFRSYVYEKIHDLLHEGDKSVKQEVALDDNAFKGMNVLVAEDNELNWEVISELFKMYGITSEWAQNGQLCLNKLNDAPPGTYSLVLMDVQMPVMNGRDATKAIRSAGREDVRKIPIIAMTADAFAEDIAASLKAGMDGHVAKPVDMGNLFQEIQRVLEHGGVKREGRIPTLFH